MQHVHGGRRRKGKGIVIQIRLGAHCSQGHGSPMSLATMCTQAYLDNNPFSLPPPSPMHMLHLDPKAAPHVCMMSSASHGLHLPPGADWMSITSGQPLDPD